MKYLMYTSAGMLIFVSLTKYSEYQKYNNVNEIAFMTLLIIPIMISIVLIGLGSIISKK